MLGATSIGLLPTALLFKTWAVNSIAPSSFKSSPIACRKSSGRQLHVFNTSANKEKTKQNDNDDISFHISP